MATFILAWLWKHPDGGTPNQIIREFSMVPLAHWSAAERIRTCGDALAVLERAGWIDRAKGAKRTLTRRTPTEAGKRTIAADARLAAFPRKATWRSMKPRLIMMFFIEQMSAVANPPSTFPLMHVDLPEQDDAFAKQVLAAARASKTGRFGSGKVFISHVLQQLEHDGFRVGNEEAFKARLVSAHRQQLLSLSRADLVEAMDPKDVDASETAYLSATFHFVRI
ncbi:hypothetical protein [Polyangium sp. y55x31]|uniref:hypothetical protein n=1 Tax=Polyangium sp. y55x31 TaxID=3042688 RepID=UPI0024825124|nr:hypothetical protein [Polyangium sp. y55x31]MDI1480394.1 hypothetical protein [Polyangium sp. y55x31]